MDEIINDYIELKINELVNLKFDKEYPEHGKGRLHLVTQSIEKDLINLDYDTQISILDRLAVQIMQREIKLFHESKFDLFEVDITDDLLKWVDKQSLLWELKMTANDKVNDIEDTSKNDHKENKTAIWAYYYHILHTVDSKTRFENDPAGKVKAIERIALEKNISAKNFQMNYNELEKNKTSRTSPKKKTTIKSVIDLFSDNPKCLELANYYLEKCDL